MHTFVTACISALGEDINEMADMPLNKTISNSNFIKTIAPKLGIKDDVMQRLGYDTATFFANDWAMSCHSSYYQGHPCYYVRNSAIEYVYVDSKVYDNMEYDHEIAAKRQYAISDLTQKLEEKLEDITIKKTSDMFKTVKAFFIENREEMLEQKILMSSLATYAAPFREAAALVDKKVLLPEMTCSDFIENANMRRI